MEKEIIEIGVDLYDYNYTYEHLKVACVVQDFLTSEGNEYIEDLVYEDIAKITINIYEAWEKENKNGTLSEEEFAYIQAFAYRFLEEYFEGERKQ